MSQVMANTLRKQLGLAHQVLEGTMNGISHEQLHWQPEGNAHTIAANYAHVVVQEDVIINALLKGDTPLFAKRALETMGLSKIPPIPSTEITNWSEWGKSLLLNLPIAKNYSDAVYANTDAYLATVSDEELEQRIDTGFLGEMSKFELINLTVLSNCNWHTGEISSVKGLQNLQGYPF